MKVRKMAQCALFAALICVCSYLAVPVGDTVFTMQTFGVFFCLGLLGGKRGSAAIAVYLALGAVGLPVFTHFQGGIGALLGMTGGYLVGFLVCGLVYWLISALGGTSKKVRIIAMILSLIACYAFGSLWFRFGYLQGESAISLGLILIKCVVPYLLPDALKLALAWFLTNRLKPYIAE